MSTETKTPERSENVKFYSMNEFRAKINMADEPATVVKNPNGGKLFLAIGSKNFKCQQTIDPKLSMKVIVDNDDLDNACLANVKEVENNVLFTL